MFPVIRLVADFGSIWEILVPGKYFTKILSKTTIIGHLQFLIHFKIFLIKIICALTANSREDTNCVQRQKNRCNMEDGGTVLLGLRDLTFSPNPRQLSQMGDLKFFTLLGGNNRIFSTEGDGESPSSTSQEFTHPSPTRKSLPQ